MRTPLLALTLLASLAHAQPLELTTEPRVDIPMRDGTILRAQVQRPVDGGAYPVLMLRTPYGAGAKYKNFAAAGYIVVTQDARGRYMSDGLYDPMLARDTHDAADGFDTVQWCAKLPGSTGEVGTFGVSYNGFTQWRTASLAPPALKAMAAFSIPARHTDLEGPGSIRPIRRLTWWYGTISAEQRRRAGRAGPTDKKSSAQAFAALEKQLIWTLPWSSLPDEVFEEQKEAIFAYFREPQHDMWRLDDAAAKATAPNLNVCGWYDHCNSIALHQAIARRGATESARRDSRLIVGPWAHNTLGKSKTAGFDFGQAAAVDLDKLQLEWFDHFLKGKDTAVMHTAPVRIFVMGRNQWRDEQAWPPARAVTQKLFLASGGNANTPAGDGKLLPAPASGGGGGGGGDRYSYDPRDPVISAYGTFPSVADQSKNAARRDILVYQSEPLTAPLEVTGEPVMELHASSSAPDTDWIVRLIDVPPTGAPRDVSTGILRARYRDGFETERFLKPGEMVKYTIRMNPTSNEFQPGHRIRVDVTSSDFPGYDRNHNTAVNQNFDAQLVVAQQTIHHGAPTPSAILLPVIKP